MKVTIPVLIGQISTIIVQRNLGILVIDKTTTKVQDFWRVEEGNWQVKEEKVLSKRHSWTVVIEVEIDTSIH